LLVFGTLFWQSPFLTAWISSSSGPGGKLPFQFLRQPQYIITHCKQLMLLPNESLWWHIGDSAIWLTNQFFWPFHWPTRFFWAPIVAFCLCLYLCA
jgi:hypothetical protein